MVSLIQGALGVVVGACVAILGFAYRVAIVALFLTLVFVLVSYCCLHAIGEGSLPHIPATVSFVILLAMSALKGF